MTMNEIRTVVDQLRRRGFALYLSDGAVRVRGDTLADDDTATLLAELKGRKDELVPFLLTSLPSAKRESADAATSKVNGPVDWDAAAAAWAAIGVKQDKKKMAAHWARIPKQPTPLVDALLDECEARESEDKTTAHGAVYEEPESFTKARRSKQSLCRVCGLPLPVDKDGYLVLSLHTCGFLTSYCHRACLEGHGTISEAERPELSQGDTWRRQGDKPSAAPLRCHEMSCKDDPYARVVRRVWSPTRWDWMCHRCGREVKS
jgi:hypothetical protein